MAQVFISYSRTRGFALFLQEELKKSKIDVWVDTTHIRDSYPWKEEIDDGLKNCSVLIVVISPAAVKSGWVRYEWEYALREGKPIVPVLFYETEDIPEELKDIQIIPFTDKFSLERLLYIVSDRLGLAPRIVPDDAPSRIKEMIKTLYSSWNPQERITALQLLGKEKYEGAIPAIGSLLLEDEEIQVRLEATKSLEAIGSKTAIPYLEQALADENPSVRNSVVKRLGFIGGDDVVDKIAPALNDLSSIVQRAAMQTLVDISSAKAVKYLISYHIELIRLDAGRGILSEIVKLGEIAVPILVTYLQDTDSHIRKSAASLLFHFRNPLSGQPLIQSFLKDENLEVRRQALYSLSATNFELALPYLLDSLNDKAADMRLWAATLLGNGSKSSEITNALQEALSDDDE